MAGGPFLFLCLGWNMVLEELWDFSDKHWDANLRKYAEKTCTQDRPSGYGIWVFPRGLIHDMQPFAIGRLAVGSWLIYDLLSKNVPVVDLTAAATSIHQFHDYGIHHHLLGDIAAKTTNLEPMEMYRVISQSPESKRNIELAGGENKFFPPAHVTWVLTPDGKLVRPALLRRLHYRFYSYRIPGTSWKPFKPIMGPLKYPVRFMRRLRRNRFVK